MKITLTLYVDNNAKRDDIAFAIGQVANYAHDHVAINGLPGRGSVDIKPRFGVAHLEGEGQLEVDYYGKAQQNSDAVDPQPSGADPFSSMGAQIEWSYHEDNHRSPRDFWHARVSFRDCTTDWEKFGDQERQVLPDAVKAEAEERLKAEFNKTFADVTQQQTPTSPAYVEPKRITHRTMVELKDASNLAERDSSKPAEQQGLFRKFDVRRTDGSDQYGGKHYGCRNFVLDVDHDPHAAAAMTAYAASCEASHPELAADLRARWGAAQLAGAQPSMPEAFAVVPKILPLPVSARVGTRVIDHWRQSKSYPDVSAVHGWILEALATPQSGGQSFLDKWSTVIKSLPMDAQPVNAQDDQVTGDEPIHTEELAFDCGGTLHSDGSFTFRAGAWHNFCDLLASKLVKSASKAETGAPKVDWPAVEAAIKEFVADYEMIGENESGHDGVYSPTEAEQGLIEDAIHGLLADNEFMKALHQTPSFAAPEGITITARPAPAMAEDEWLDEYGRLLGLYQEAVERGNPNGVDEAAIAMRAHGRKRVRPALNSTAVAWMVPRIESFDGVEYTSCPPDARAMLEGAVLWSPSTMRGMPAVTDKHGVTHRPRALVYADEIQDAHRE